MILHVAAAAAALVIGHSVDGRPIVAYETGPATAPAVLVVGCIHGNEQAGMQVVRALRATAVPHGVRLVLIPTANPDGVAGDTRQNAHGVDLNRNFPVRWRPLTGVFDSGPKPLSEPETRAVYRFVRSLHPLVTIWFHQHMNLVEKAGRIRRFERIFSVWSGLALHYIGLYDGSTVTWENATFPGTSSFAVELPAGTPTAAQTARYVRAVLAVARAAR